MESSAVYSRAANDASRDLTGVVLGAPRWGGLYAGAATVVVVLVVQLTVGTMGGPESAFRLDRPYHIDLWYYAALARVIVADFPPHNPAFAGALLSQHSFHLLPLSLLSLMVNPYVAMRLLNVVYAVLALLLLRRYFPGHWGSIGFCLLAMAPLGYALNPMAVDFVVRGFYHMPFLLALLAGLFETRRPALRFAALLLMPWLHGLMALSFFPAIAYACWPGHKKLLLGSVLGFVSAGLPVMIVSQGQGAANMLNSIGFWPLEPLIHLLPLVAGLVLLRSRLLALTAGCSFLMATFIGYNPFYFIFPLDAALGVAAGLAVHLPQRRRAWLMRACVALGALFFVRGMVVQFGEQTPFPRKPVARALDWVEENTPPEAVFLQAGLPLRVMSDQRPIRQHGMGYWILEKRNLYTAYCEWVDLLGLPGIERNVEAQRYFLSERRAPDEVDYVFYGPLERFLFPRFQPRDAQVVYRDEHVVIFKVEKRLPLSAFGWYGEYLCAAPGQPSATHFTVPTPPATGRWRESSGR